MTASLFRGHASQEASFSVRVKYAVVRGLEAEENGQTYDFMATAVF